MEYVGRRVKKEFQEQGTFIGVVQAYEPATGLFKVVYDGGDSEELELSEVSSHLLPTEPQLPPALPESSSRRRGRKPKKRWRVSCKGKDNYNSAVDGDVHANLGIEGGDSGKFDLNLNGGMDLNDDGFNNLNDNHVGNEAGGETKLHGLDLNKGLNLGLNEGLDLNRGVIEDNSVVKEELFDLNLDMNDEFDNSSGEEKGRHFDLNLLLNGDEIKNTDTVEEPFAENERAGDTQDAQMREKLAEYDNKGSLLNLDCDGISILNIENAGQNALGKCAAVADDENVAPVSAPRKRRGRKRKDASDRMSILNIENDGQNALEKFAVGVNAENVDPVSASRKRRGRKRKDASVNKTELVALEGAGVDAETGNLKLENGEETPLKLGSHSVDHDNGVSSGASRGRRGRKRKELTVSDSTVPTPEAGLRRSCRRAKMAACSDQDHILNVVGSDSSTHQLSSPAVSTVSDEKIMATVHGKGVEHILPPKVELPPSSCKLDLNGVSIFDLFSVYAFLRSFSTLLFLSPFELDDFVASVKCNDSTLLFDSIHVALLKTLRKHLESLCVEGSESASNCLRSLNWDFLDLITWPMFVAEYFLLYNPGYVPGLDPSHLELFLSDHYKLPVSVKIEILRHLCDDVIEMEAFRTELSRRTLVTEQHIDFDRTVKFDSSRKRKYEMDVANASCITEEDVGEMADWNSDECCLCKMDGNLICCDGCPAAFHSRCVGVVSSLLPEGDWYCPECAIEKDKPWMKVGKSIRGADLLGVDPYGRLFYSSCGYLLVLESCNDEYSCCSYNINDLPTVVDALEASPLLYDKIITTICKHWNLVHEAGGTKNELDNQSYSIHSTVPAKSQLLDLHIPAPLETLKKDQAFIIRSSSRKLIAAAYSCNTELENAEHISLLAQTDKRGVKMENQLANSEGSAEVSQASRKADSSKEVALDSSKMCTGVPADSQIPGKLAGDNHITSSTSNIEQGKNLYSDYSCAPSTVSAGETLSQVYDGTSYVNFYKFARTAASFFEEHTRKVSDKSSECAQRSVEEIIAGQVKVVSNRFTEFSWSDVQKSDVNFRNEKCGWCFFCKFSDDERDCLFIMNESIPSVVNFTSEILGVRSRKSKKNHLIEVICHIICIEDHLRGLLLGPWLNPHYSANWRMNVLGVSDIAPLKDLLLKFKVLKGLHFELEANLHHRALSDDWRKHVDSVATVGSACHIVSSSARASSKHAIARKRSKSSEIENTPSSNAATGLSLFWWRGGRGSRKLFNWKVLPRSLASKAARKGGRTKIPDILYPDNGEYAKRTRCVAWRAAVETSRSVEQLALQVRELDAYIKWDDIGNINLQSKIERDWKKSVRSFKKVIIRRKCSDRKGARYLLDFGKRRFIPDIVVRHGSLLEESSSERKKYWLEESHVPLHLLKAFEEKRIARKSSMFSSGKLRDSWKAMRKPFKKKGFAYLFSRAERSENYQCGHCNKDVLIREAVSCEYCKGFFHKRHVRRTAGALTAECTYTCHKCRGRKVVKFDVKKGKAGPSKLKNSSKRVKPLCSGKGRKFGKRKQPVNSKRTKKIPHVIPLRRSARTAERISKLSMQTTTVKKRKKGKQSKSGKRKLKKTRPISVQKKRTPVNSSYWLNGLHFSRKPDDERLVHFRSKMLLVLPETTASLSYKPKCSLCSEGEYTSHFNYVACEICGAWFHGDALGLGADRIKNLIGFKCYVCLEKRPPICPHHFPSVSDKAEIVSMNNNENDGMVEDHLPHPDDISADWKSLSVDESKAIPVDMEKQSSGSPPEFDHKDEFFTSSNEVLAENDSVKLEDEVENT